MKINSEKNVFPTEVMWLWFLIMGLLGALTIARESFILAYLGKITGQHAVVIGYLLAGMASIGLFKCYRASQKSMEKFPKFFRLFWAVYATSMTLSFIFERLELPQPAHGILLIFLAATIAAFGHNFYCKLKKGSAPIN